MRCPDPIYQAGRDGVEPPSSDLESDCSPRSNDLSFTHLSGLSVYLKGKTPLRLPLSGVCSGYRNWLKGFCPEPVCGSGLSVVITLFRLCRLLPGGGIMTDGLRGGIFLPLPHSGNRHDGEHCKDTSWLVVAGHFYPTHYIYRRFGRFPSVSGRFFPTFLFGRCVGSSVARQKDTGVRGWFAEVRDFFQSWQSGGRSGSDRGVSHQ